MLLILFLNLIFFLFFHFSIFILILNLLSQSFSLHLRLLILHEFSPFLPIFISLLHIVILISYLICSLRILRITYFLLLLFFLSFSLNFSHHVHNDIILVCIEFTFFLLLIFLLALFSLDVRSTCLLSFNSIRLFLIFVISVLSLIIN